MMCSYVLTWGMGPRGIAACMHDGRSRAFTLSVGSCGPNTPQTKRLSVLEVKGKPQECRNMFVDKQLRVDVIKIRSVYKILDG